MNNITLYTTHCPKCKILEDKLNNKNIQYNICEDKDEMISLGFRSVPVLQVNDEVLNFGAAIKWVNNQ